MMCRWNCSRRFRSTRQTSKHTLGPKFRGDRYLHFDRQLTHPLVSPLLQASLGNLCPLYILAGDAEVLVDEVMYLAHKAAYPASYPLREGAMMGSKRQQENAKKFTTPTNVHLQIYDGMPHVLTVFGYTDSVCLTFSLAPPMLLTIFIAATGEVCLSFRCSICQACHPAHHLPW